jgi:hypothetical protein
MLRTLLILAALAFAWPAAAADYRVGDRLPASKGASPASRKSPGMT